MASSPGRLGGIATAPSVNQWPRQGGLLDTLFQALGGQQQSASALGPVPPALEPAMQPQMPPQAQTPDLPKRPGFFGQLLSPEVGLPTAAALLDNGGDAANFGAAFGTLGPALKRNRTMEYIRQTNPKLAEMVDQGLPIGDAWKFIFEERQGEKPTSLIQEYNAAVGQGYDGSIMDYQMDLKRAGAASTNVTVGGGKYGPIPQGYELFDGPNGTSMRAIPGGPEDTSKKDALAQGQADVATRVVTSAAARAREAAKNRQFGGYGQSVVSNFPWTDSAEVARQVNVLKSTAKVENLTAMRAASPTGGALGSVTEKEADMLAAKSGALDPSSPTFDRDLDDYELTLLQVVHGPQEGQRIWQMTRDQVGGNSQGGRRTSSGVQWEMP